MENVVIFGASQAGENFILNQTEYNIIAAADNDMKKWGEEIEHIKIIDPTTTRHIQFDKIIVTSMFFNPIKKQLVSELGIEENKIIAANKNLLKKVAYPFEHKETLTYANQILLDLCDTLRQNNITYFVDFGTLLGIVRDDNLIAWDDDIDLTCYLSDVEAVEVVIKNFVQQISSVHIKWAYSIVKTKGDKLSSIVLSFSNGDTQIQLFSIDVWLVEIVDEVAIQTMNQCDALHFQQMENYEYLNRLISVPYKFERYLTHTYGDWKTPVKDTTFADYPYAFME